MAGPGTDPNAKVFLLPDLGEGLDEAELHEWNVEIGQEVEEGQELAKMETAKALVDLASPRSGTIAQLHGNPGDVMKVGMPIVTWADGAEESLAEKRIKGKTEDAPQNGQHVPPAEAEPGEVQGEEREEIRTDAGTVVGKLSDIGGMSAEAGNVLAAPAVRRLARDLGVEIVNITGTGIGGRVTAGDVRQAGDGSTAPRSAGPPASSRQPRESATQSATPAQPSGSLPAPEAPPFQPGDGQESVTIPFRGVRRTIAARLRASVDHAVHFSVMDEVDVTALDALRKRLATASGEKLSLLPFVCLAIARVLSGEFGWHLGRLNSRVNDDVNEITQFRRVHLGIAVDTPSGLMVPVLRDADRLGVLELGRKVAQLAIACRDRSVPREDLEGSTFTISNFGSYAGRFATPIINYPESGILAVGRMRDGVVVKSGMLGVGKLLPLSLTSDHRVIDGATATMTLNKVIELLQTPDTLLPTGV